MRALVISSVIGALALSGCQSMNTGTGTGGIRDYDKAAIGAGLGALAGYGLSRSNANSSAQNNRAAAIGAIVGAAGGLYLDKKEQKLRQQMAGTGVEVNRNSDGSVGLVMPGNITFATNSATISPSFYTTNNRFNDETIKMLSSRLKLVIKTIIYQELGVDKHFKIIQRRLEPTS